MKKILFFTFAVALLTGCSKELTEDVAVPVTGKSTIYATYDGGQNATRTTVEPNGSSYKIKWELGDAVGVFDAVAKDDTNAYFAYAGGEVAFNGDLGFLNDEDYVGYYPYEKGRSIDADGNITLTIPATQNYRFNAIDEGAGSFAQNVAPAVAYGTASADNQLALTFYPMATYLRVPIQGIGTVKTLKLEIDNKKLAGDFTVNLDDVKEATKASDIEITYGNDFEETSITLECGKRGVELNPSKETYFWFVVPAGLKLKDQTMTITVNETDELTRTFDYDAERSLPVNTPLKMGKDSAANAFEWVEGGAFLIKNEYEFLMYAYAATNGIGKDTYEPMLNETKDALLNAFVIKDLDFSPAAGFNPDPTISVAAQYGDYVKTVLFAYTGKGNAIATIGNDDNKFEISGNVDGKAAKIANLTVKGTAMFNDGQNKKLLTKVSNLIFANSTVDAKGLKKDAAFLTNRDYKGTNGILLKNITVEDTCQVLVDTDQKSAVVGRAFTDKLSDGIVNEVEELPYANVLYVMNDVEDFVENEIPTYNIITVHSSHNGAILNVADQAAAKELIGKIDLTQEKSGKWFSVVSGYKAGVAPAPATVETSYWTGTIATDEKADGIFTAEELAKVVNEATNLTTGGDKLTNDIDLMGDISINEAGNLKDDELTGLNWGDVLTKINDALKIVKLDGTKGEDDKYTVSNAWVEPAEDSNIFAVTLFGVRVGLTNIKVESVYVSDKYVGQVGGGISGLATFAQTFKGVEANQVLVSAYSNTTVGGLVRTVRNGSQIEDVYFSGRIAQHDQTLTRGTIAGEFATMNDTQNIFTFTGVNGKSVGTPANLPVFGKVQVHKPTTSASSEYDVVINFYNFNSILPTNFVARTTADKDYTVHVTWSETKESGSYKDHKVEVAAE